MPHNYPIDTLEPGLDETAFYDPKNFTFPAGTHVGEVEVDPETGIVEVVNFTAVDDFGRIINPMIVEGQVHGGLAQGIGQALYENAVYDAGGQLLTGSYMDYCMPRADDVPSFKVATHTTLCTHNPLGVKGLRRGGRDRRAGRGHERGHRCARAARRHRHGDAGDARARLARDPEPSPRQAA